MVEYPQILLINTFFQFWFCIFEEIVVVLKWKGT